MFKIFRDAKIDWSVNGIPVAKVLDDLHSYYIGKDGKLYRGNYNLRLGKFQNIIEYKNKRESIQLLKRYFSVRKIRSDCEVIYNYIVLDQKIDMEIVG